MDDYRRDHRRVRYRDHGIVRKRNSQFGTVQMSRAPKNSKLLHHRFNDVGLVSDGPLSSNGIGRGNYRKMAIWGHSLSDPRHINLFLRMLLGSDFDAYRDKSLRENDTIGEYLPEGIHTKLRTFVYRGVRSLFWNICNSICVAEVLLPSRKTSMFCLQKPGQEEASPSSRTLLSFNCHDLSSDSILLYKSVS